jgi:serine/threonine-protein kinase
MKRCPECRRDYYDDTLNFCLDDGAQLLDGPALSDQYTVVMPGAPLETPTALFDRGFEPATAIYQAPSQPSADIQNSIAVLPLVNMSADLENEYFCDGLAEELINALARVEGLKVVARTSAFSFKGKNFGIGQIASILNVSNIVEGSVRKFGDRMRISMQLVSAADGYHVWSEKYDTGMRDIFDVQDDITRSVVNALKLKILGRESTENEKMAALIEELQHHARDVDAYQLYLRGKFLLNKFTTETSFRALECFTEAALIDPKFAEAYAGIANSNIVLTEMGPLTPKEAMPKAKEAALKAISLNENLSEGHYALGLVLQDFDYDFGGAEREFRRAIELNHNNSQAHQFYGYMLAQLGRHDEAKHEFERAVQVDPLSIVGHWLYGFGLFQARKYDECIAQTQKVLDIDPKFPTAFLSLSFASHMKGRYEESVEHYARFRELIGSPETAELVRASFKNGDWEGFLRMITNSDPTMHISHYIVAIAYAALGEKDNAINKLLDSYDAREPHIVMMMSDPRFDEIRKESEFQDLLKRVGFPV